MIVSKIKTKQECHKGILNISHSFTLEVSDPIAPCAPINEFTVVIEWYIADNYGVLYYFDEHLEAGEDEEYKNFPEIKEAGLKLINELRNQQLELS